MSVTAPYDPRALTDISSTLETTCTVNATTASGLPLGTLDVESLVLTMDEAWAPHARLELTVALDAADATHLDSRKGVRIVVALGYRYTGGALDQHPAANLTLWAWSYAGPGRINVEAQGDELLLMGWTPLAQTRSYAVGSPIVDVITDLLAMALGRAASVEVPRTARLVEPLTVTTGASFWDVVKSLSEQAGIWTYADSLGTWRIAERPRALGQAVVQATTGPNGIVTEAEPAMTRDDWANTVVMTYPTGQIAYATQPDGPFGTAAVGVVAARESTSAPWPGSIAAAQGCASLLALKITRGNANSLTALAAWWVRPGHTITTPDLDRVIVSRVRFSYPDSLMTITTREA